MSPANGNGASRVGLWLSIAISGAVLISMVGAMFYVAFSTKTNSEEIAKLYVLDVTRRADIQTLQLEASNLKITLNEIETQFCAQDIVRNLMHANDLRTSSLLWQKVYGEKPPTDNSYYPTICNRRTR